MFDHAQSARLGQRTPVENPGVQLVTAATLPEVAYRGQIVYLLDEDVFRVFDGVGWQNPTASAVAGTQTFVGPDAPAADAVGDLWMNNTTYQLSVWDGSQWRSAVDPRVTALQQGLSAAAADATNALNAQTGFNATLAGKNTTYYTTAQPAAPDYSPITGDLWINTVTNRLYRFSSPTTVTEVVDSQIVDAWNKAGIAKDIADAKITTYYAKASAPPTGLGPLDDGDLWIVEAEEGSPVSNLTQRWNGSNWVPLVAGADAISDHAIGAFHLEPMIQLGSTITTRTLDGTGQPTGTGLDITPNGLVTYDQNGDKRVELPNNPLLPAVFRGDAEIDHLTVGTLTTLQQTVLAQGSVMALASGVARPSNPPSPATAWNTTKLTDDGKWATRKYLAVNGTNSYTISTTATDFTIERWTSGVLGMGRTWSNIFGGTNGGNYVPNGLAHDGTNLWLLVLYVPNDGMQGYYLHRIDPATLQITKQWNFWIHGSGPEVNQRGCAMSWDAVNSRLIVAQSRTTTSDFVRIHTISDLNSIASVNLNWTTLVTTNFAYAQNLSSLGYGLFDFNDTTNRYFFQNYGTSNAPVITTAGVRAPTYEWDNCWGYIGSSNAGTTWDAGTSTFVTLNRAAQKVTYETGTHWIGLTQGAESTWFAAYSWRGAPINFTAVTTSGQTTITVSSTNGLNPGLTVTGSGIPANTSIVSVGAGAITLSAAATATAAGVSVTTSQPETVASEGSPFTMLKRARVILYASSIPAGVASARFYIARGGTVTPDSLTSAYKFVGDSNSNLTSPSFTVTAPGFGPPYDNPIVSTFGSGIPANLSSTKKDSGGVPYIGLNGDGSGRVGPLSWDNTGFPLTQPSDPNKVDTSALLFGRKTVAASTTSQTASATGLSLTLAVGTYTFVIRGQYQAAATTTGIGFRIGGTAVESAMFAEGIIYGGANSSSAPWFSRTLTALGQATGNTTGVQTANTPIPFRYEGFIIVATAGTFTLDFTSQIAGSAVQVNAGSSIQAVKVA